jgi:hypothetical protein
MNALLTAIEVDERLFPSYIDELSDDEWNFVMDIFYVLSLKLEYPQLVNEDGSFDGEAYRAYRHEWSRVQAIRSAFIHATKNEIYAVIHKRTKPRYSKKAIKAERKTKIAAELKRRQEAGQLGTS